MRKLSAFFPRFPLENFPLLPIMNHNARRAEPRDRLIFGNENCIGFNPAMLVLKNKVLGP